jgi:2'-5' RNA ligase
MRLFVGLDLPPSLRARLALLAGGLPGARWTPPENYHVTLRFIGEVEPWRAEEADGALAGLRGRGFALDVAGVGNFETSGRPTQIWAGIARTPELDHLHAKVETALQRAGFESARKRWQPHVTLGRVDRVERHKLVEWLQANALFRAASVPVGHFTLFSSRLGKEASAYTAEVEYELA